VSDSGESFIPTDPGPFQKYLFSGACYIKLGQCYSLVKQAVEQGQDLTNDRALAAQLIDLWTDFLYQQTTVAKELLPDPDQASDTGLASSLENLGAVIQQAGSDSVKELIDELDNIQPDMPGLNDFFIHWASACDKAYATMVQSKAFSLALGATINNLLQDSVLHSRPPATKDCK
jgi:hypothetical protein